MTQKDIKEETTKFDSECMKRDNCNGCPYCLKCFPEEVEYVLCYSTKVQEQESSNR